MPSASIPRSGFPDLRPVPTPLWDLRTMFIGQPTQVRYAGGRQPFIADDEVGDGEVEGVSGVYDAQTRPLHPAGRPGSRAGVPKLGVEERAEGEVAVPRQPPRRVDQLVGLGVASTLRQIRGGQDPASLNGGPGVLIRVRPALGGDHVFLARQRQSGVEVAGLENHGSVAEDEVHRAVDVALAVELAEGVGVEGILVPLKAAPVERRLVRPVTDRHRLMLGRPRRVPEGDVYGHEPLAKHRCQDFRMFYIAHKSKQEPTTDFVF
ncbi:unnamed protein product [Spirodela intermedia]|uniref:Uncharacterized protein n=1 Tax=Spirodela intermedia TaxID=51605 RepID=A0A7I8KMV6_SPIIN|nr:unnamed protein product [Spirodela intermedia]